MTRKQALWSIGAPLASLALYLAAVVFAPEPWRLWIVGEQGPVELATAALFLAAGVVAASVAWRAVALSTRYRVLFAVGAVAATFIALEELSYGQHLFGWSTPEWVAENNARQETNLHNLYDNKLSRRMRTVANLGIPLAFVVLPIALRRRRDGYRPGSFAWAFVPGTEFACLALVAGFCTLPQKVAEWMDPAGSHHWMGLGELKELYWSIAAMGLLLVLHRRHVPQTPAGQDVTSPREQTPLENRRRAA